MLVGIGGLRHRHPVCFCGFTCEPSKRGYVGPDSVGHKEQCKQEAHRGPANRAPRPSRAAPLLPFGHSCYSSWGWPEGVRCSSSSYRTVRCGGSRAQLCVLN